MKSTHTSKNRTLAGLPLLLVAGLVVIAWGLAAQPARACNGNGIIDQFDEVCDDGNLIDGDGCSSICQLEASSCVDDITQRTNVCTANDVRIALVLNQTTAACELGSTIDLNLIAELEATSAQRWDIGMFVALDGGTARTGTCHQQALSPPLAPGDVTCTPTCSISGDACFKDADCPGAETCSDGYIPGSLTLNPDGTINTFSPGGPFYDGECSEDPADLCGDLEQNVFTYFEFPAPVTVPCQDNDGDGAVDIGSCLSWDNGRSDGGNKPSCLSIGDTEPNTKAKCKCETINIGNVYVAGKIIVEKVCDPVGAVQDFDFISNFDFKDPNADKKVGCGESAESVSLEPSEISGFDYSVEEDAVPNGWFHDPVNGVVCTSDNATPADDTDDFTVADNKVINLGSGETVTCVFTNIEPDISIDKDTAALLTKTGDEVTYNIQVCYGDWDDTLETCTGANTDGPALECSIEDSVVGDVTAEALAAGCTSNGDTLVLLTPNDVCMFDLDITVPDFDGPSFSNTAIADCTIVGESAAFSDTDTISVLEFTPAFDITKTGDAQSKVGDDVSYTFTLSNTSSAGAPDLTCTATDDVLGVVFGPAVLPAGDTVVNETRTVLAGDPNPLVNNVTLSCELPDEYTNVLDDATDSHSVALFTPAFDITKTGDALSKVGDDVDYTFTLSNTSSANTPDLTCTATDDVLGVVFGPAVLPAGDTVVNKTRTVLAGDPDPLVNNVTLSCTLPAGFTNVLENATDSHSVALFTPAFDITKTGDALSKVGDDVDYTFTLSNTSSAGAPDLTCTATDDVLGVVFGPAVLPAGDTVVNETRTVLAGDPNPLVNEVTLSCTLPAGFTNVLDDATDSHSVALFTPAFDITKTGDAAAKVGDDVDYTFTLSNTSSAGAPDLTCTATDDVLGVVFGPAVLPAGDTVVNETRTVLAGDPNPLVNNVTLSCTLPAGFTNVLENATDSHSVALFTPAFDITKTGDASSKVGDDVDYTFTLSNTSSAGAPDLTCTATDDVLGVVFGPAVLPAGDTVVNETRTVLAGDPNPLVNNVTLSCTLPAGFTNVLENATDSHSVALFTPAFDITKTGDASSKVGDDVDYTFTLSNTSSAGAPDLTCTATDDVLGVVFGPAVLPAGDTVVNETRTVLAGDPNPLVNNVTLSCTLPAGFTNVLENATDSHSVALFTPAFDITKTGDASSKVGDDVDYTFTLSNTSSAGAPDLTCTATDDVLGVVFGPAVLPAGDTVVNKTHTVLAGDPNPLVNNVTLSCTLPAGFTNVLENATDSHSVALFTPAFDITKTGDASSKVGDDVDYTFTLSNTSSAGAPDLTCTATDDVLGVVFGPAVLPAGDTVVNKTHTVLAGDPNPLVNNVTLSCTLPAGFTNVLENATDSHSVALFTPAFDITKTGDASSKVGDDVDYTFTLSNTSSAGAPDLTCTATDDVLGVVFGPAVLPAGDTVVNETRTVLAGDPNPLVNNVTLSCTLPAGFTNVLENATDSHSVALFTPAFDITKTGDASSKVGDDVDYTFTLSNTSSAGAPDLTCTATDDVLGVVFGPAVLPAGDTVVNKTRTVLAGDPNPLVNNVTLSCTLPAGFTNVLENATDSHSVNLVNPSFTVVKSCTNEPVPQDGPALFNVLFTNEGDVALVVTADDGIGTFTLVPGTPRNFPVSLPGPFAGQATVSNTVSSTATIPLPGLPNILERSDSATCFVAGEGKIIKLTQGLPNEAPNPETRDWRFTLHDCGSGTACTKNSPVIAEVISPPSMATFSADLVPVEFDPDQTYRICEVLIPVAWTNTWMGDANDDGTPETLIPFVPAVSDDPVVIPPGWSGVFDPLYAPPPAIWTNDERCINFVANAGETEVFEINNEFPGGEPRTIGYWKNWDSCSGGGQVDTAIENCGPTSAERLSGGCALLDDVLQPPGITIGVLPLVADDDVFACDQGTEDARNILDKRSIDDGKKRASDAAYALASQLLAAIANDTAGAGVCPEAGQAVIDGQNLLVAIGFDGTGSYFKGKKKIAGFSGSDANELAGILDSYNNGTLCAP